MIITVLGYSKFEFFYLQIAIKETAFPITYTVRGAPYVTRKMQQRRWSNSITVNDKISRI